MMMTEFTERTDFEPTAEEYAEIKEQYYSFSGDKDAFCINWKHKVGIKGICEARAEKIAQLRSTMLETEKHLMDEIAQRDKRIADLEAKLDRELEWKPWTNKDAVDQEQYDHLRRAGREMTDDEAKDWIADEWGFDRSKIRICRKMKTFEVNRHSQLRQVGEIDRDPYYDATDWYYVFFRVCGMEYEAYNGSLAQL